MEGDQPRMLRRLHFMGSRSSQRVGENLHLQLGLMRRRSLARPIRAFQLFERGDLIAMVMLR